MKKVGMRVLTVALCICGLLFVILLSVEVTYNIHGGRVSLVFFLLAVALGLQLLVLKTCGRKRVICIFFLIPVCLLALFSAYLHLSSVDSYRKAIHYGMERNNVCFEETVLYGNSSWVDGLVVQMSAQRCWQYGWDSTIVFEQGGMVSKTTTLADLDFFSGFEDRDGNDEEKSNYELELLEDFDEGRSIAEVYDHSDTDHKNPVLTVELNHNATSGVVAWDGERFAIVTYDMDSRTDFVVDIVTADGLQFSGRYHSSLPELYGEILDYGMEYDQYGFATLFPLTAAWGGQS